jgi:hypothetical protein
MTEILEWPELERMSREQLFSLITGIREGLAHTEDAEGFCLGLAKDLKVDVRANHDAI